MHPLQPAIDAKVQGLLDAATRLIGVFQDIAALGHLIQYTCWGVLAHIGATWIYRLAKGKE